MLPLPQEVVCARAVLQREGTRLGAALGELVPVVLCPGQGRAPSLLGEGMGSRGTVTTRGRRVFLSTSQGEDMFWAVDSVNFVIDAGVEKRYVSLIPIKQALHVSLEMYAKAMTIDILLNELINDIIK